MAVFQIPSAARLKINSQFSNLNSQIPGAARTRHTFLFQQGLWLAEGFYFDETDQPLPFSGFTEVRHADNLWINRGRMEIGAAKTICIENSYRITPFPEGAGMTTWESENPALGTFIGKFYLVGDSIISTFVSQRGTYAGCEFLLQKSESSYLNRGVFTDGSQRLSSWVVELSKQAGAGDTRGEAP